MTQSMVDEVPDLLATMGNILTRFRALQGTWVFWTYPGKYISHGGD